MRLLRHTLTLTIVIALSVAAGATSASLITGAQVKDGSLTGRDLRNGSVKPRDLNAAARGSRGPKGPFGPAGPAGIAGPQGPRGERGPDPKMNTSVTSATLVVDPGDTRTVTAVCNETSTEITAIGGGYKLEPVGTPAAPVKAQVIEAGRADSRFDAYNVKVRNDGTQPIKVEARGFCMNVTPLN